MAEALLRSAHLVRDDDYADTAREALAVLRGRLQALRPLRRRLRARGRPAVPRAGARDDRRPARRRGDARAGARPRCGPYVASRIVQIVDPVERRRAARALRACPARAAGEPARAYVHRGRESYAETSDADAAAGADDAHRARELNSRPARRRLLPVHDPPVRHVERLGRAEDRRRVAVVGLVVAPRAAARRDAAAHGERDRVGRVGEGARAADVGLRARGGGASRRCSARRRRTTMSSSASPWR